MFIIGKKEERVEGPLRKCIGDENIKIIYDYFDSYYSVMHQQDEVIKCKKSLDFADKRYYNACYTCWGALSFLVHYSKYAQLGRAIDDARSNLDKSENDYLIMEGRLNTAYNKFLDSKVLLGLENARNYYSTVASEPTSEDLLKDLVLNNELELIEDHFIDKLEYDLDKKSKKKKNKYNYHEYGFLEEKLFNVALQNQLLRKTIEKKYDAEIVYDVIDTCYSALERRDNDFDTGRFNYLNDDILDYVNETKKSISTTNKNKTKRR